MPQTLPVLFLTDFGRMDDFAGVCHAVVAQRAPGSDVIHVTHGIDPQDIVQGALMLRNTLPYTPIGVHVAVVDPGVGTDRRGLAVACADGRYFVGPDNGLLVPAIQMAGGATRAVSLESAAHRIEPVSPTFHGRDIFAPAAAHLASGGDVGELGPDVSLESLVTVDVPGASVERGALVGQVWHVDRFGNVALSIDAETLHGFLSGHARVEVQVRNDRYFAAVSDTYANVREGGLLLLIDSYGSVTLSVNRGDARSMFRLASGDSVRISAC